MKKGLFSLWITIFAAMAVFAGIAAIDHWLVPFADSILTDVGTNVKEAGDFFEAAAERPTVILDAGHGGEDSGAIGVGGVLEKDLNLSLTLRLRDLLTFEGWRVILTRSDDRLLYDPNVNLSHKTQDLKTRLQYETKYPDAVFVSIHMNQFPAESCKGLQVYYSPNHAASESLALGIQSDIKAYLSPSNQRECKRATTSIFILNRIRIPAVLVECGFISNGEEAAMLQTEAYQKQMAAILTVSLYNQFRIANQSN